MAQGGLRRVDDSVPARPCLPRSGHAPGAVCPALHGGGSELVLLSSASPDDIRAVGGFRPRPVPIRGQNAAGDHPHALPRRGDRPARALPDGGAEPGREAGAAPDPATAESPLYGAPGADVLDRAPYALSRPRGLRAAAWELVQPSRGTAPARVPG